MLNKKDFLNQIKYNIVDGIMHRWVLYIVPILFNVLFCAWLNMQISIWNQFNNANLQPSVMDYLLYFFKGMEIYVPKKGINFEIPIAWLFINLYLAFIIANYPTNDLLDFGKNIFIHSKTRLRWFLGKCVWVMLSVLLFYLAIYLVIVIFSGVYGDFSLQGTNAIINNILGFEILSSEGNKLFMAVLLLPFTTSMALSFLQMLFEFILKPIYSFLIIASIIAASAYYCNPILIGNNGMLMRNEIVLQGGLKIEISILINSVVAIVSVVLGCIYFKRYDILDKK